MDINKIIVTGIKERGSWCRHTSPLTEEAIHEDCGQPDFRSHKCSCGYKWTDNGTCSCNPELVPSEEFSSDR